jgi:hypothetical protein
VPPLSKRRAASLGVWWSWILNVVDKSHKNTGQQSFVRRVVATWGRFMLLNECDVGHITGKVEATEHGLPFGQNDTQVSRFIRGVL